MTASQSLDFRLMTAYRLSSSSEARIAPVAIPGQHLVVRLPD